MAGRLPVYLRVSLLQLVQGFGEFASNEISPAVFSHLLKFWLKYIAYAIFVTDTTPVRDAAGCNFIIEKKGATFYGIAVALARITKAILIDDMIDTAGTITLAAQALQDAGALDVYACQ